MKHCRVLYLFVLFIAGYYAQDTTTAFSPDTWNGDSTICTVPANPPTNIVSLPTFPKIAEFTLEAVEIRHIANQSDTTQLTLIQYLYDFDANKLIMIRNTNGFIDAEYYYYEALKKAVYIRGEQCFMVDISTNIDIDGTSAIQGQDGTWHIRPLNEFLLFSNTDPRQPQKIVPIYIGETIVRGIPVNKWETCIVDKSKLRTIKRTWYFARRGFITPVGPVGDLAYPVQAVINSSILLSDGTPIGEFDEVFDIYSYKPGLVESADQLAPPRGVFCGSGAGQPLISLERAGMAWPQRFSVRVEASSSRSTNWQKFHLRYETRGERNTKRIRYDYLPTAGADYQTVIHDYGSDLTYRIDRRTGLCKIDRGVGFPDVNPLRDPISFFIKYEEDILTARGDVWEINGIRTCRGNSIKCQSVTTEIPGFPAVVDADTNQPTGETWNKTSVEYGWSVRSPLAKPPPGQVKGFDYPVYLFMRFYRLGNQNVPSPLNIRTEDIEYEFYEMSYEVEASDFDTSTCYRSLNYEYSHLGFTLKFDKTDVVDSNRLDRRVLEREIRQTLGDRMQIKHSRIANIEAFHESSSNLVNVFFTLLGPTPEPESDTGLSTSEPSVSQSRLTLQNSFSSGAFQFSIKLSADSTVDVVFKAVNGSLKESKQFMSTHAAGPKVYEDYYKGGAQAGGVIGGILVGLIIGALIAAVIRIWRQEPMPPMAALRALPTSFTNRLRDLPNPQISFYKNKTPVEEKPPATSDP